MAAEALFQPWSFKGLNLKNRLVMAPMTRSFSPDGVVTEEVAQYYRRRAAGEVGLIVTEGTGVDRVASLNDRNIPRFHGEKELAGWKRVADEVHAEGGAIAPQLWHVGAVRSRDPEWKPEGGYDSPSGLSSPGKKFGEGMSEEAVADAIDAFARAAADAKRLGFETVELHGAHGYLIDQFLRDSVNDRTGPYGGSIGNRARLLLERRDALAVPRTAVTQMAGQSFVFVVGRLAALERQPGKAPLAALRNLPPGTLFALQTPVQLGELQGNHYPLQRGLQRGDRVVTAGLLNLRHGAPVQLAARPGSDAP
jgi:2,4-dienoyl-CoA reductase-like NADH-dependent reductase (Old Yellow Enzyme family)